MVSEFGDFEFSYLNFVVQNAQSRIVFVFVFVFIYLNECKHSLISKNMHYRYENI